MAPENTPPPPPSVPHPKAAFRSQTGPSPARVRARRRLRRLIRSRQGVWIATISLVLAGAIASLLGASAIAGSDADKARLAFHLSAAEIAASLKQTLQHEEDLVVSASAFFAANPQASPADFDRWLESVHAMQRYPELENVGLVRLVPASRLARFEARLAANPVRPLGPNSTGPIGGFQILPPGRRPYYCFAVAGMARSVSTYLPAGLDYCKISPQLLPDREAGVPGYAPVTAARTAKLGVETPLYRTTTPPPTRAARRRQFVGWLGELLAPDIVLKSALRGHPSLAVTFRYDSRFSHVAFTRGTAARGSLSTTIPLFVGHAALGNAHEGWTVQTYGAKIEGGILENVNSLTLLIGGTLLSVVLGLLMLALSTGRIRALSLVRERTRELYEKNRELSYRALHDTLTGLPNRALVLDRTERLLARASRQPEMVVGALFLDIDSFKDVNDNLGHAAGDQLLRTVAQRLQNAVRSQDTVGRLSGDEFVVLGELVVDDVGLDVLANRLTDVLREPVELDHGRETIWISVTASIGVAVGRYASADDLLRDADLALYSAKAAGKDRCALFEAGMHVGAHGRVELHPDLSELSAAVQQQQFYLAYQPIFELPSRKLIGVEALIRWRHLRRDVVLPGDFIPLAEESGLIMPIGRWVLDEACRQAAEWAKEGLRLGLSVNVSAYQLGRERFAEDVREALARHDVDPCSLTLEITETTLMRNTQMARRQLEEIKALGVRIAIDDFGTGYASLSQLQRLPIDTLKIDRSFVAALNDGERGHQLLRAILNVGRTLSLDVVAEGVEEPSQLSTLETMGCMMCQGFLLAEPGPPELIGAARTAPFRPAALRKRRAAKAAALSR
jgi:diguanylate cyclase (GGDEF)-like protein